MPRVAVVTDAVALFDTIDHVSRRRPFELAVSKFAHLLTTVPDYRPTALSDDSIAHLATLAEQVIAMIEHRVSSGADKEKVQLELVSVVYDIRRALEEIDSWHRHFRGISTL